jgi:hypothetical protein
MTSGVGVSAGREALTGGTHVSAGEGEEAGTDSVQELLAVGFIPDWADWLPGGLFLFFYFLIS